jgi:hypothetical protein
MKQSVNKFPFSDSNTYFKILFHNLHPFVKNYHRFILDKFNYGDVSKFVKNMLNIDKGENLNRIIYSSRECANIEKKISKTNIHDIEPIDNSYDFLNNNFKAKGLDLTNILSDKIARSEIKKNLNILLNSDFQYPNKEQTIDSLYKQLNDLNEQDIYQKSNYYNGNNSQNSFIYHRLFNDDSSAKLLITKLYLENINKFNQLKVPVIGLKQ